MQHRPRGAAAVALLWLAASVAAPSHAAGSLDEWIARDRAIRAPAGGSRGAVPIALADDRPEGVTAAIGGPAGDVPTAFAPPLRGEGGLAVRLTDTAFDGRMRMRLGAAWQPGDDHPATLDGTGLVVGVGSGELYASVERRHWGPAWSSSLILDGGARPVPAVGWRRIQPTPFRSRWLSWLGPWSADVFAGELSQRTGPRHARLIGARMQVMPVEGLELGASRTLQWGGSGRPETVRALWNALFGRDNSESPDDLATDPSNQLAGFDVRYTWRLAGERSVAAYVQVIGEDEAGMLPSHRFATWGVDVAGRLDAARWRVWGEWTDTTSGGGIGNERLGVVYRHSVYTDGYTHLGEPLGHPHGGDVRLATLGGLVDAGRWRGLAQIHYGRAQRTATEVPGGGRLWGAAVETSWQWREHTRLGVALQHARMGAERATRTQLRIEQSW